MDQETIQRRSVLDDIEQSFAFLNAVGAHRKIVSGPSQSCATFVLPSFFIEVEIDWREHAVFTLVGKLDADKIPDGYYVDNSGRRCRWHLAQILEHGGRPRDVAALRRGANQSGPAAMATQIAAFSTAIRHALDDLPGMLGRVSAAEN